jgi:hypothetical protein
MRARKSLLTVVISALFLSGIAVVNAATPKTGAPCAKSGIKQVFQGKTFACIKSGKKLVWSKGVAVKIVSKQSITPSIGITPTPITSPTESPTPISTPSPSAIPSISPTPTPTSTPTPTPTPTPTSFENLYENRSGISATAWRRSSKIIMENKAKFGSLEIYTGPNSKPYFDDYPMAVGLVSKLFPNQAEPTKTIVIRFRFIDMEWADSKFKEVFGDSQYQQMNTTENGKLVPSQCNSLTKNCPNSMQQTSRLGTSLILQGIQNSDDPNDATGKMRTYSGMLEAHEYFHSLQRIPIMGKSEIWPHAWFREGGAEWVQNMAVNFDDFKTYSDYLRLDCAYECQKLTESEIAEFLRTAKENYLPSKFPQWLNYSLGSHVVEALIALNGPDVLIDMYAQMAKQISFDQAFKNIYGVEWSYAIPILAKTIYANLKGL